LGLARLDAFVQSEPDRYLALTDEALRLAAELWAKARQQGRPTSPELGLDIDVILAAQALVFGVGAEVIVVTTNPRHLRQFVDARLWNNVGA
jgi:predicted nucleic acid-binding protein